MDETQTALFNGSFSRCLENPRFFDNFYERFTSASPEIRYMFRSTDFARQKRMLEESLRAIVSASEANIASDAFLAKLAERHKHLRIKPVHYGLWEETLLDTVRQCDPQFSTQIRGAWIAVLQRGINFLKNY